MSIEKFKLTGENERSVVINNGVGTLGLLGVAFIVMKLLGYITWSWVWVLAPFWIPLSIVLLLLIILLIIWIHMWKQSILEDSSVKEEKVKVSTEATKKAKEDATVTKEKKTTKRKKKVDD